MEQSSMLERVAPTALRAGKGKLIHVCRSAWISATAYAYYRAILLSFLTRGGSPPAEELAALAQQHGVALEETLQQFALHDLVQRHPATGEISAAYPFSGVPTVHRVRVEDVAGIETYPAVHAMCALDALGIPLMLRRAAWVDSQDALTGEPLRVRVIPTAVGSLRWSAIWEPVGTVVFARPMDHEHPCGSAAAQTCCGVTQFFTTGAHAAAWSVSHSSTDGRTYTQVEALNYAATLFAGIMDRSVDETRSVATVVQETAENAQAGVEQVDGQMPRVQVLYFASCPHTAGALALVREVLRGEGLPTDVELIAIETQAAAEQHRFYGSPTVRVDGHDVSPPQDVGHPALACRLYPQPDGSVAPHPPAVAILNALRRTRLPRPAE
jgi:hypothetical protein